MNAVQRLTAQDLTASNVESSPYDFDVIVRITADQTSELVNIGMANTGDVTESLKRWVEEKDLQVSALVNVVQWQHSLLDYNAHYVAFLLEQISEEEFEKIAETFAYEPERVSAGRLAPFIERIYSLTNIAYTPSDLAGLFKCDQEDALEAIRLVAANRPELRVMLPTPNE